MSKENDRAEKMREGQRTKSREKKRKENIKIFSW